MAFTTTSLQGRSDEQCSWDLHLDLKLREGSVYWRQHWHGLDGDAGIAPANNLVRIAQSLTVVDSWQDELERQLASIGDVVWLRQAQDGLRMAGIPDGIFVEVAFPVNAQRLPQLATFYEDLWAHRHLGLDPTAYVIFVELPVTRIRPHAVTEADWRWADLAWREASAGLGLLQPFAEQLPADGSGSALILRRKGMLHVASLCLRDLIPYVAELVSAGIVSPSGGGVVTEQQPSVCAAGSAVALTTGTALDSRVNFTRASEGSAVEYPLSYAKDTWLDAFRAGAMNQVTFETVKTMTSEYSSRLKALDQTLSAPGR